MQQVRKPQRRGSAELAGAAKPAIAAQYRTSLAARVSPLIPSGLPPGGSKLRARCKAKDCVRSPFVRHCVDRVTAGEIEDQRTAAARTRADKSTVREARDGRQHRAHRLDKSADVEAQSHQRTHGLNGNAHSVGRYSFDEAMEGAKKRSIKKNFLLELMTIDGCKGKQSNDLEGQMIAAIMYIRDNIRTCNVLDPANSNNFLSDDLDANARIVIQQRVDEAVNAQYWSQVVG